MESAYWCLVDSSSLRLWPGAGTGTKALDQCIAACMDRLSTTTRDEIRARPRRTGPWDPETLINREARATSIGHLGTGNKPLIQIRADTGTEPTALVLRMVIGVMDIAGSSLPEIYNTPGGVMKKAFYTATVALVIIVSAGMVLAQQQGYGQGYVQQGQGWHCPWSGQGMSPGMMHRGPGMGPGMMHR